MEVETINAGYLMGLGRDTRIGRERTRQLRKSLRTNLYLGEKTGKKVVVTVLAFLGNQEWKLNKVQKGIIRAEARKLRLTVKFS